MNAESLRLPRHGSVMLDGAEAAEALVTFADASIAEAWLGPQRKDSQSLPSSAKSRKGK